MNFRRELIAFAALSVAAPFVNAQTPSVARVTPYAGYMTFGNFVNGPLGTGVRNKAAPVFGAQLGIDLTDNFSFVGNVGYSSTKLQAGVPIVGGFDLADSKVLLYDAGLQYRLPVASLGAGMAPFVEAGAGAMRTEVGAGGFATKSTAFAVNYGAGVDLQLSRGLAVRAMAKDYVGKLDLKEAVGFDFDTRRTHNWAFTAGVSLKF